MLKMHANFPLLFYFCIVLGYSHKFVIDDEEKTCFPKLLNIEIGGRKFWDNKSFSFH